MAKYFIKRLIRGLISVIIVVAVVMLLVYTLMSRDQIFAQDPLIQKMINNSRITYKYQMWEQYGYLDYVTYGEWVQQLAAKGEIDEETRDAAAIIGKTEDNDSELAKEYIQKFKEYYGSQGYSITRLDAITIGPRKYADGGKEALFAYKDIPVIKRLFDYFGHLITIDNIHFTPEVAEGTKRGIKFTLYDPVYGGKKFSPAIIGNGTKHKYLLYVNNQFPFIHQNLITISLGTSYSVNQGKDVFETMTATQGSYVKSDILYPTGLVERAADNLHSAVYSQGSREVNPVIRERFVDDYTNVITTKRSMSKMGFSFVIGIFATIISYIIGIPLGIIMARKKDGVLDTIGTCYIVFITAVPALAYIFLFKAIGRLIGLPTLFDMDTKSKLMYVLPVISLSLPAFARLMRWVRRYMIDQMNADYVKFARSGGLSENEIFTRHILKNASIPIVHGIPGEILFAMTGAIMTEAVYVVPGAGNLLREAIAKYDNGVIIGLTLFYAILTVLSHILGDILIAIVDPRISFSTKDR